MVPWVQPNRPLILGSQSPRRKHILSTLGIRFQSVSPELYNEKEYIDPRDFDSSVRNLAQAKALTVAKNYPKHLVLGADTIVLCGGLALGKPESESEASAMLHMLSGKTHEVCSGVCLVCLETQTAESIAVRTRVLFRTIRSEEISSYLKTDEYRDKAGAYAIQGQAMIFVESIEGCYYNVVGLPVQATIHLLRKYSCL